MLFRSPYSVEPILADQRPRFEIDDDVAYFNTANMSPLLRSVRAAGEAALERRSKPWTISPPDWFTDVEELRSQFARLIGSSADDVALWTEAIVAAVDERVAIASVPNVHWTNGALIDLYTVEAALRQAGAAFVLDASQSLGAMPLDVASLRPDALVAVGYKWLLGPYTLSYLYLDPSLHDGEPLEENWIARAGSDDFSSRQVAAALGEANVFASVRGSSLRISPHLHNNQGDVDRLLDALASAI